MCAGNQSNDHQVAWKTEQHAHVARDPSSIPFVSEDIEAFDNCIKYITIIIIVAVEQLERKKKSFACA